MQLLSIAITLVVVVLVSAMILKKYKPHAILLGGGIVLLLSAQFLGINNIITDVEKSTGFWLFDVFELMRTTLQKDAGATGMVIMAAGAFVQGASIELSADGPIRPPYAVYFQGGLTWFHAKLGILMSIQKLLDAGIIEM